MVSTLERPAIAGDHPLWQPDEPQPTESTPSYTLRVDGVSAVCDAWAVDEDSNNINFFSVIAPPSTIKTIRALLGTPGGITGSFTPEGEWPPELADLGDRAFYLLHHSRMTVQTARISGLHRQQHLLALHNSDTPDQSIPDQSTPGQSMEDTHRVLRLYARREGDLPRLFHRHLTTHTPVLTVPEWAEQVWQLALDQKWAKPMRGVAITGYTCSFDCEELQDQISAAIANGEFQLHHTGQET